MDTILSVLLCGLVLCCAAERRVTQEKLYEHLMFEYNKDIIPLKNEDSAVEVKVGITLLGIKSFKDDVLTFDAWVSLLWNDVRLTWNPDDYDGFQMIQLPRQSVWIPDITLYNRELTDHGTVMPEGNKAMLRANGDLFMSTPSRLSANCRNNKTSFDASGGQFKCNLRFGSWVYNGFQIDVLNQTSNVDTSEYFASKEWELMATTLHRNVAYYPCCQEPYPDVTATVYLKRREF